MCDDATAKMADSPGPIGTSDEKDSENDEITKRSNVPWILLANLLVKAK